MPQIPIIMPQLGESIAEATVTHLLVQVGHQVKADQDVLEVETNKATMNVTSPCPGRVEKWLVKLNESYPVGAVLGYLEVCAEDVTRLGLDTPAPAKPVFEAESASDAPEKSQSNGQRQAVEPTVRGLPVPAHAAGASFMSPRLKARIHELGLHAADLAGIAGSGAAGRVTIEDFEKFIANLEKHQLSQASSMRVAVADAMRRSWTRPLATVALPVCVDPMLAHRKASNPNPGPALYALRARLIAWVFFGARWTWRRSPRRFAFSLPGIILAPSALKTASHGVVPRDQLSCDSRLMTSSQGSKPCWTISPATRATAF